VSLSLCLLAFVQYRTHERQQELRASMSVQAERDADRIRKLEARTMELEGIASRLGQQTSSAMEETQRKLAASSREFHAQQQDSVKKLSLLADEQHSRFDSLNGDLSSVKSAIDQAKEDVSTQSGLIALNHDQLQDLKRRGEKDFLEFSLRKSKESTRVGDLALQLTRTDVKHQKYNMTVMADDKRIEKKDKTALEPVQFYMPGDRRLTEVVVWDVRKDQVTGYVSIPKGLMAGNPPGPADR
jgi:chromosome segregation ATPase